jgi:Protein of unknown function (DUF3047)
MLALFALLLAAAPAPQPLKSYPIGVLGLQVLKRDSGPVNYYKTIEAGADSYVRADYLPPLKTVALFQRLPDHFHKGLKRVRWRWRALVLPLHGNECADGKGDSAAAVYMTWKSGLRYYSLKFIWSAEAKLGQVCNKKRNPFVFSDSIVLRTGTTSSEWVTEEIDPNALFQKHFIDTGETDSLPEFQGFGLLTDGDQTLSESSADYAGFEFFQ